MIIKKKYKLGVKNFSEKDFQHFVIVLKFVKKFIISNENNNIACTIYFVFPTASHALAMILPFYSVADDTKGWNRKFKITQKKGCP